ncbi:HAD-IA family hydrolase [Neobacillus sp. PS3-34]|uniref:HAD family hydrolase n=1 Tax=Neobacillus sp. PS3-34 TaxID=3070678 RepID=UPI0027DEF0F9|nr:HAD-IA family hydrolase [Neobacillus sp. PS3-34]WML49743.1 HAD-IA family hydrolase [Neobacillus sp. PS3-34]
MLKAIIFDFDGTIIDTETVWFRVFKEVLEEQFSLHLPVEEFAKVIGTTDEVLYQYIESQLGRDIDKKELRERVDRRFLDLRGVLEVREGVLEKIKEAQSLGYKIALASSSSREWIDGFLEQFDLRGYFSVIKTKEDVEKVKPDPSLYLKALQELGVEPQEALAIEDSANGALAAIAAGMNCAVIPNEVTSFLEFHEKAVRSETFGDLLFK